MRCRGEIRILIKCKVLLFLILTSARLLLTSRKTACPPSNISRNESRASLVATAKDKRRHYGTQERFHPLGFQKFPKIPPDAPRRYAPGRIPDGIPGINP